MSHVGPPYEARPDLPVIRAAISRFNPRRFACVAMAFSRVAIVADGRLVPLASSRPPQAFIERMAATPVAELPRRPEWSTEIKLDG
jgi:hypothetical protein